MIKKYRKKPVIVEALRWTGGNHRSMFNFLTNNERTDSPIDNYADNYSVLRKSPTSLVWDM